MPGADENTLGPAFESRLRDELDGVRPLYSYPRYAAGRPRAIGLRLAPVALAISLVAILSVSAFAATGSPNPAVWTQRVITVINSAQSSPNPPAPTEHGFPGAEGTDSPEPSESAEPKESPEPAEAAEPAESPAPRESPEPRDSSEPSDGADHSGSGETSGGSHSDG